MKAGRKTFRAECEAADEPCWICTQRINYAASQYDEDTFELDHFHPVSTHPELAEDPTNWRAAHRRCNQVRGADTMRAELGTLSRAWFG